MKALISSKVSTIRVVRRGLLPPAPGEADARHSYQTVITTRAEVKSLQGGSQWGQVEINGTKATHKFKIRYTKIPFDSRDRILDALGGLYQILSVTDVDLKHREIEITAAEQGNSAVPAAR